MHMPTNEQHNKKNNNNVKEKKRRREKHDRTVVSHSFVLFFCLSQHGPVFLAVN